MQNREHYIKPSRHIGIMLRDLRKSRKLTGVELGVLVGISQSKIAKIENGYSDVPRVIEVEKILNALDAPKTIRQRIDYFMRYQSPSAGLKPSFDFKYDYSATIKLERASKEIRCFGINMIPAVLQTITFREEALKAFGSDDKTIAKAIHVLLQRQDLLWDPSRSYHYIIPETALYTAVAGAAAQIAQLDRLDRIMSKAGSVRVGIIPTEAGLTVFETGSFAVIDERLVVIALGNYDEIESWEQKVIYKYLNAFDLIEQKAIYGDEAIVLIRKAIEYFGG